MHSFGFIRNETTENTPYLKLIPHFNIEWNLFVKDYRTNKSFSTESCSQAKTIKLHNLCKTFQAFIRK